MSIKSIALCRVSTPEQKTEGHSLERQEASVLRAADTLQAPIARTWSLDQSSRVGKNLNRKDLQEMQDFCRQNKQVKYLIVDEPDRFMRDIKYFYYFEAIFEQLGVKVWYASQPELNTDNMMGKLQKLFLVFRAEASNDERMSKSLNGLKARVKAGYSPFPLHQGYVKGIEPGLHIPDPIRFPMLQEAFREVLSCQYTVSEATQRLNEKGYKTPNGTEMRIDKFRALLKDPYYAGAIWIDKWDENLRNNKALHKPMISMEEWEELQLIVDNKKRKFERKKHNPKYPLSNMLFCKECQDKKIVGFDHQNGKGWVGHKYRCRGCGKQITKEKVHLGLDNRLSAIKFKHENAESFIDSLKTVWADQEKDSLKHVQLLDQRLEKLKNEKSQLVRTLASNPELADDIKESIDSIKSEISKTEKDISEAQNIEKDLVEFLEFSLGYIDDQCEEWWGLTHEERLECKQLLFKGEIFLDFDGKVYTPQISPVLNLICDIKEGKITQKSSMVELVEKSLHPIIEEAKRWKSLIRPQYEKFRATTSLR